VGKVVLLKSATKVDIQLVFPPGRLNSH
jgi:hypothetical protein